MNVQDIVERYVAIWNEPDEDRRRTGIVSLWSSNGLHRTSAHSCRGYATIEARVRDAHRRFVAEGRHVFRSAGTVETHHNVVRFDWLMAPADGGPAAGTGFDLFILADDGRIEADYQFTDRVAL